MTGEQLEGFAEEDLIKDKGSTWLRIQGEQSNIYVPREEDVGRKIMVNTRTHWLYCIYNIWLVSKRSPIGVTAKFYLNVYLQLDEFNDLLNLDDE